VELGVGPMPPVEDSPAPTRARPIGLRHGGGDRGRLGRGGRPRRARWV